MFACGATVGLRITSALEMIRSGSVTKKRKLVKGYVRLTL
jgi:hypothetical protein